MSTAVATEYRTTALTYINHKLRLSTCRNYKTDMSFQRAVMKLRDLRKWLQGPGKMADQIAVFKMLKMYRDDFYNALPHPMNDSYQSSSQTLKEIFE